MNDPKASKILNFSLALLSAGFVFFGVGASQSFGQNRTPAQLSVTYSDRALEQQKRNYYPWANEDKYRDCGQACLYKKANENLTMQMLYTLNLIDELKSASSTEKFDALGPFCDSTESGDECFARYKARAKLLLLGVRRAIVEHKAMVGKLKSNKKERAPSGEYSRAFLPTMLQLQNQLGGPDEASKYAQAPSTLTVEQLTQYYNQEFENINRLVSREYEQWTQELPSEPAREDFIIFREIKRDPRDPESEVIVVPETNCQGNKIVQIGKPSPDAVCYNEKKYNDALAQFKTQRDAALNGSGGSGKKIKLWGPTESAAYAAATKTGSVYKELPKGVKIGSTIAQSAYQNARRALNRTTRKARGEEVAAEQKKKASGPELPSFDPSVSIVDRVVPQPASKVDPDDEEPAPQRGTAAKDLSVSVQPKDDSTEPGAKDQFLDETLAIDPSQ